LITIIGSELAITIGALVAMIAMTDSVRTPGSGLCDYGLMA
jgi:hypothetical protein